MYSHSLFQPWQTHNSHKLKQQTTFLESSWGRFQKIRSHSSVLCTNKGELTLPEI